jgi:hypothetical protein
MHIRHWVFHFFLRIFAVDMLDAQFYKEVEIRDLQGEKNKSVASGAGL